MRRRGVLRPAEPAPGQPAKLDAPAGQKVDKLKSSPSFFFDLVSALRSPHTRLHILHLSLLTHHGPPRDLRNACRPIFEASPSPGSDARARAAPWERT